MQRAAKEEGEPIFPIFCVAANGGFILGPQRSQIKC